MHTQAFINTPPVFRPGVFKNISFESLLKEVSLFSCSPVGIGAMGGPIVKNALEQIQEAYGYPIRRAEKAGLSAIVDVRVQRLMPAMYPSIPGWHCDHVPRSNYTGQPEFGRVQSEAFSVALLLSSEPQGVSNTEYVLGICKPKIWDTEHVYRDLHRQVERIKPETICAKDGDFTYFTPKTIHRAKPCVRRGVRLFMRFSMYEKPPITNAVASSQQVYILSEDNGW